MREHLSLFLYPCAGIQKKSPVCAMCADRTLCCYDADGVLFERLDAYQVDVE